MSTEDIIKTGLQQHYPQLDLAAQFQQFVDDEEYDSDLIRSDIMEEDEDAIIQHLLLSNSHLNKDDLNKALHNILNSISNYESSSEIEEYEESEDAKNAEPYLTSPDSCRHPHTMIQSTTSASSASNISKSIFAKYLYDITSIHQEINTVKHLISKYCPSFNDNNLILTQTISFIIKKPFHSWIMDTFDRFKIDYYLKNKDVSSIDPLYFSKLCRNFGKYLNELEDLNEEEQIDLNNIIPKAMHEYNKILPTLDFKPKYKIDDNYYEFVSNVIGINELIHKLVISDNIYPFQFDVWFIPHKMKKCNGYKDDDEEKKQIDDMELESALLEVEYGEEHYDIQWRELDSISNHKYVFNINNHNEIIKWIKDLQINIEANMRYVLVIDRRRRERETDDAYCLIHVHQDRIHDTATYFDEEYFEKSKRFVFVSEDEKEKDWGLYDNNRNIFCLSYHVLSKESIKIYWNVMNKKIRFKMEDLWHLWPIYFDQDLNDLKDISDKYHYNPLEDIEFEEFYQLMTRDNDHGVEQHSIEEYKACLDIKNAVSDLISSDLSPPLMIQSAESTSSVSDVSISMMCDMLSFLKQSKLTNKYPTHFRVFEGALKEQFDDTDFEIDCVLEELLYFNDGDIDESEILTKIKEEISYDYNEYISGLIEDLQRYINQEKEEKEDKEEEEEKMCISPHKICTKHFLYHCIGECGNDFGRYLFGETTAKQKSEILTCYLWSFDYELRQKLIDILTETSDCDYDNSDRELLSLLNGSNVFVDDDQKWIKKFENIFCRNYIGFSLSQITCNKKKNNLILELMNNNIDYRKIKDLQININRIRNNLNNLNINLSLSNDEISVLYIMANDDKFDISFGLSVSCKWKSFHLNLISAINKLKKYRFDYVIANELYCFCYSQNKNHFNLNQYLNQITLWTQNKLQQKEQNILLSLKQQQNIQIIPIQWILNTRNKANDDQNIFIILPFRVCCINEVIMDQVAPSLNQYTIPPSANCQSIDIIAL